MNEQVIVEIRELTPDEITDKAIGQLEIFRDVALLFSLRSIV
jgi:hypothetical protein